MTDQKDNSGIHNAVMTELGNRAPRTARRITLVLSCFILASIVWATEAEVPGLVRAPGEISAGGQLRRVEHLDGGTVSEIHVAEGDSVREGDIIAVLSDPGVDAGVAQLKARIAHLDAGIARLTNLLALLPQDPTPETRLDTGETARLMAAQRALSMSRRKAAADLIRERASAIRTARQVRETLQERLDRAKAREEKYLALVQKGSVSRAELDARSDERAALQTEFDTASAEVASAEARRAEAQSAYDELILSERELRLGEMEALVVERIELILSLTESRARRDRLYLRAPVTGVIQTLHIASQGDVVSPGSVIADILPTGSALTAEVRLQTQHVGQVSPGDQVAITVTTYDRKRFGQVEGTIQSISPTSITEENSDPYFKMVVALADQSIGEGVKRRPLRAGMVVQAEIVTGTRTVAQYLLKPLDATMRETMTEK